MNSGLQSNKIDAASTLNIEELFEGNKKKRQIIVAWFKPALIIALVVLFVLACGYLYRGEYLWQPEFGVGYWFGITGASMMLMLLLYPLRKRSSRLSLLLSVKQWFKLHMLLGVVGPMFIVLHCNFRLGSMNSSIALLAMFLMVGSGLVGRFLYSKIHRGLYGSKLQLREIVAEKQHLLEAIQSASAGGDPKQIEELHQLLSRYEIDVIRPASILGNFVRATFYRFLDRALARKIKRKITSIDPNLKSLSEPKLAISRLQSLTRNYMRYVRKTAELSFYEKLFSLWHMLHLPIFALLIASTCFHIYAVHNY